MIGSSRDREAIATLQEAVQTLTAQVTGLSSELAALAVRYVAGVERAVAGDAALALMSDEMRGLAALIGAQDKAIADLKAEGERREKEIKQCKGMIARLERQAEIDLIEMRETNTALASTILRSDFARN
jgi:chromosome segregation ATPase